MVESQVGLIPIIIWTHFILGLAVLVKDSPDGNVIFGTIENPPIIIKWSPKLPSHNLYSGVPHQLHQERSFVAPTIYLLDASLEVVLKTEPHGNEGIRIEGQECHRLRGYGTTSLQRKFNTTSMVVDNDPIYAEAANFAVAFALLLSKSMRRVPFKEQWAPSERSDEIPTQCYLSTEQWRLFDSSKLLFWGLELDKRIINGYVEKLTGVSVADMVVPSGIRNYLQKLENDTYENNRYKFIENIKEAASWILAFAQVVDIESCAELPLTFVPGWMFCKGVLAWEGLEAIDIESDAWFNLVLKMMRKDTRSGRDIPESEGVFLTSHNGWSLFYNSVGDHDPGTVNCELLSIKRGVPTNTLTEERKYRISDAPSVERDVRLPSLIEKGTSYLSRCITKVYKRTEHYSSRSSEFWLSIRFDIEAPDFPPYTLRQRGREVKRNIRYPIYASHAQFHKALWGIVKTLPCGHPDKDDELLPLDLGAVTVAGLTWANGQGEYTDSRIFICLVKGDARGTVACRAWNSPQLRLWCS